MIARTLFNNPTRLKRCTGLTIDQFVHLAHRLRPVWEHAEKKRLSRKDRKRAMGAGHPFALKTIEEKLFCILLWYKLYPSYWFLGMVVGMDAANVCRLIRLLRPLVSQAADPSFGLLLREVARKRKKISSWEDLRRAFPDVAEILIDATEQQIPRPKKQVQRKYYSGKKKRHTVKAQVVTSRTGKILSLGGIYPGHWHDYTIFKRDDIFRFLPPWVKAWLDRGYDGITKDFPSFAASVFQPVKRRRNKRTLTRNERRYNRQVNSVRVTVEHVISRLKKYQILAGIYRTRRYAYAQDMRNIAALVNYRHDWP